jgi:hypothetical protein
MERQAGVGSVSHDGGVGAWTPVANVGTGADSAVSALPAVAAQRRRPPGRGQTVPRTRAAVGPTDHSGGGAALA